jgi:hypothetical protein
MAWIYIRWQLLNDIQTDGEHFEEAIRYIEKHRLYTDSLVVWKEDQEKHSVGASIRKQLILLLRDLSSDSKRYTGITFTSDGISSKRR